MGFLDKAKAAAEQAAAKAKEGVDDVQAKRELSQTYNDLGKTAYELIESGDIAHPRLEAAAAKVRTFNESVTGGANTEATVSAATESYDSSQPPAMPT
ncbi:MAG TPA: hypothetical protein VIP09_16610 [Dehalococcoidia bacterium]